MPTSTTTKVIRRIGAVEKFKVPVKIGIPAGWEFTTGVTGATALPAIHVAIPVPTEAPTPAPTAAPTPAPTSAPQVFAPVAISTAKMIVPTSLLPRLEADRRYVRGTELHVLEGETGEISFEALVGSFERPRAFDAASYTLTIADKQYTASPVGNKLTFNVNPSDLPAGYHWLKLEAPTESVLPHFVYVKRGEFQHGMIPFTSSTHGVVAEWQPLKGVMVCGEVDSRYVPAAQPLAIRKAVPFDTDPAPSDLYGYQPLPIRRDDVCEIYRTKDGIYTTAYKQPYFNSDIVTGKREGNAVRNGARGQNAASHFTFLGWSKRSDGKAKLIALTATALCAISEDGTLKVLAGETHDALPYWQDGTVGRMVGQWRCAPGLKEPWGYASDPRTFDLNVGVPGDTGEDSHKRGVVSVVCDTGHSRVLKLVYDPLSHSIEPIITELAKLNRPFSARWAKDGRLFVSEQNSRIVTIADDGTVETFLTAQAEGMDLVGEWLYFTSTLTGLIESVNINTSERRTHQKWRPLANSANAQIAVSGGEFGRPGTAFVCAFSERNTWGVPICLLPDDLDGSKAYAGWKSWSEQIAKNMCAGITDNVTYPTAVAVGAQGLAYAGTAFGVQVLRKRFADEPLAAGADARNAAAKQRMYL